MDNYFTIIFMEVFSSRVPAIGLMCQIVETGKINFLFENYKTSKIRGLNTVNELLAFLL